MSFIAAILAFFLLDGTLRIVVIVGLLLTDVFEIAIWLRWRKRRSMTGVESMVGMDAVAVNDCLPEGQVKVRGEIWHARCDEGARAGDLLTVTAVDGIRLQVARR